MSHPRTHFSERQAELEKHKKEQAEGSGGLDNGDAALGKKKLEDTSPYAPPPKDASGATVNSRVENLSNQMGQANGIGRASERTYETSKGELTGGEYTNKRGTFLVVSDAADKSVTRYQVITDATTGLKSLKETGGNHEVLTVAPPANQGDQTTRNLGNQDSTLKSEAGTTLTGTRPETQALAGQQVGGQQLDATGKPIGQPVDANGKPIVSGTDTTRTGTTDTRSGTVVTSTVDTSAQTGKDKGSPGTLDQGAVTTPGRDAGAAQPPKGTDHNIGTPGTGTITNTDQTAVVPKGPDGKPLPTEVKPNPAPAQSSTDQPATPLKGPDGKPLPTEVKANPTPSQTAQPSQIGDTGGTVKAPEKGTAAPLPASPSGADANLGTKPVEKLPPAPAPAQGATDGLPKGGTDVKTGTTTTTTTTTDTTAPVPKPGTVATTPITGDAGAVQAKPGDPKQPLPGTTTDASGLAKNPAAPVDNTKNPATPTDSKTPTAPTATDSKGPTTTTDTTAQKPTNSTGTIDATPKNPTAPTAPTDTNVPKNPTAPTDIGSKPTAPTDTTAKSPTAPIDTTVKSPTAPTDSPVSQKPGLPTDTTAKGPTAPTDSPVSQKPGVPTDTTSTKVPTNSTDAPVAQKPTSPTDAPVVQKPAPTDGTVKPGDSSVAQKPAQPTDGIAAGTFQPNPAQLAALKQAGFDTNNAQDVAFLAAARAQLMAQRMGDGANQQMTLANALGNANPLEANKLAAFLANRPDATANQVLLTDANLAKLNALFKTEAAVATPALATNLDAAKNMIGKAMSDFVAPQHNANQPNQREIYNELAKLTNLMQPQDQKMTMADLLGRTMMPNRAEQTTQNKQENTVVNKPETLVVKPETTATAASVLADARTRAAELAELTPKPVPVAARTEQADNLANAAKNLNLQPENKGQDIKLTATEGLLGIKAATDIGIKPTTISAADAALAVKASEEAARTNKNLNEADKGDKKGGSDLVGGARNDMAETTEKHNQTKKKHEENDQVINQGGSSMTIDGSMMTGAALKVVDTKGDAKKEDPKKKDDEKKAPRRKYVVKQNDSLETIAQRSFKDPRLAALIAAINAEVIDENMDPRAPLKAGMSIWIPSETEVASFFENISQYIAAKEQLTPEEELARRFGNGWDGAKASDTGPNSEPVGGLMDAAIRATMKRRENVERLLGPLATPESASDGVQYTVRLGDSLKSIAMKHPALQDVNLWELVARVNDIMVPGRDPSAVKLNRGSKLRLPTDQEIAEFRETKKKASQTTSISTMRPAPLPSQQRPNISAPSTPWVSGATTGSVEDDGATRVSAPILDAGASLLRAGGFVKDQPKVPPAAAHDAATVVTAPIEAAHLVQAMKSAASEKPSVENIKQLAEDCRIVRRHQVDTNGRLYQAQMEVRRNGEWVSVMMYNISDGNCWRKSINEMGVTEVMQLELPTPAIHQMLESDFTNNWEEYRERFLKQPV